MKKIKGTIDRFEGQRGLVSFEEGIVELPKTFLEGFKEQDTVELTVMSEKEGQASQEELARNLLNEVLKEE